MAGLFAVVAPLILAIFTLVANMLALPNKNKLALVH